MIGREATVVETVALFDFDDTLVLGNSQRALIYFLLAEQKSLSGLVRCISRACKNYILARCGLREAIKRSFLMEFIRGRKSSDFCNFFPLIAKRLQVNVGVVQALHSEAVAGNSIWIVTASPAFLVEGVLECLDLRLGEIRLMVLGSNLEARGGELTGNFKFECIRANKVVAIANQIKAAGADIKIGAAYGNLPDDYDMLCLANRAYNVRGKRIEQL